VIGMVEGGGTGVPIFVDRNKKKKRHPK